MNSGELLQLSAPALLARRARSEPARIAYRAKKLGLYEERTWDSYARQVACVAHGLRALGLGAGERIAIMGDACEEWLWCDLGAQSLGAIVYGIYPTASMEEVEYQMRDGGAKVFVAEDQEYVDKILPIAERLPQLRGIVVIDASAMFQYRHALLKTLDDVIALGGERDAVALEALAHEVDPAAPAFIVYTSGTSGHPKGALVSHGKHLAAASNLLSHYPLLAREAQRTVVYLPLCHILGRDVAVTLPLLGSLVPHFGEDVDDLPRTLFEVAPSVLFTVPRYLQKFASQVLVGVGATGGVKRAAYEWAMRVAREQARARWQGAQREAPLSRLARALVFQPLLNKLGLDALSLVVCGGAPLPAQTAALWQMWGINVVEIYGQTETAGAIIAGQRGPYPKPGDVGTAPAGWEVRLGEGDEIQVKSGALFDGYWENVATTRDAFTPDGWLRTGDVGRFDGALLAIVDRARDFIVTSGGKTLSPSFIENQLRASPYVAEAMVIGHARKYLVALIEIDYDTVADWARGAGIAYTGFTSLAVHPDVGRLLEGEIARVNASLSRVEQIKAFRILPKALDPEEDGEVTPTRKLKRAQMQQRFEALVESMYDDREEKLVAAEVGDTL